MLYEIVGRIVVNVSATLCFLLLVGIVDAFIATLLHVELSGESLWKRSLYRSAILAEGLLLYVFVYFMRTGQLPL